MYVKFLVGQSDLNIVTSRYFDRTKLESEEAQKGLEVLMRYLELATEQDFYPLALELGNVACDLQTSQCEVETKLQRLIEEGWRTPRELTAECVYDDYPLATEGHLPDVDTMLAVTLTAMMLDVAPLVANDSPEQFARHWLRRKIEPLQVGAMNDFHVAMFLMDYLVDDLNGHVRTFKRYQNEYNGKHITPKMLEAFFEGCAWFPEICHTTFRTPEPRMAPVQILYQIREELRLDYAREQLAGEVNL